MKDTRRSVDEQRQPTGTEQARQCSPEEAKVRAAMEQARQNVKPIVNNEREAEVVAAELLNLRLKAV